MKVFGENITLNNLKEHEDAISHPYLEESEKYILNVNKKRKRILDFLMGLKNTFLTISFVVVFYGVMMMSFIWFLNTNLGHSVKAYAQQGNIFLEHWIEIATDKISYAFSPYQQSKKLVDIRSAGSFSYPVTGRVITVFGLTHSTKDFHTGIDLVAQNMTPVMASDGGRIIYNGWYGDYGKVIIIDHGRNYSTLYAHLSEVSVKKDSVVAKGEIIGYSGQTGNAAFPHLHFEIRKEGRPQNPLNYLR